MSLVISTIVMLCVALLVLGMRGFYLDYKSEFTASAEMTLQEMFLFIDPQKLFLANVMAVLVVPLLAWMLTESAVVAVVVATGAA